jgi:hypothetical protein
VIVTRSSNETGKFALLAGCTAASAHRHAMAQQTARSDT